MSAITGNGQTIPQTGKFVSVEGFRTYYIEKGTRAPLVLLHGSAPGSCSEISWRDTILPLSQSSRVLAFDQLGYGYSDKPDDKMDFDSRLKHILAFIESMDLKKIDLLGLSAGGSFAMGVAVRRPELVDHLAIVSSAGPTAAARRPAMEPTRETMRKMCLKHVHQKKAITDELLGLLLQMHTSFGNNEASHVRANIPPEQEKHVREEILANMSDWNGNTLFIAGAQDEAIPLTKVLELFKRMPAAQMHIFNDCGHWLQFERPDTFTAVTQNFLTT